MQTDPSVVFLTTFMLSTIFAEKISSDNLFFKDLIKKAYYEDGLEGAQSLDDPSEYISYIEQFQKISLKSSSASGYSRPQSPRAKAPSLPVAEDTEWKVVGSKEKKEVKKAPLSFSEMGEKPGNPQAVKRIPFPEKTIAQTNRPRAFFKIQIDNEPPFRVLFELRPDMAPTMVENFKRLCKGLPDGRGYKGSKIFRAKADDHILGGDFENDDGTGGHSAYEEKYFLAEQCPLKDHKGAIRMKGLERTQDGRCRVGSQFMIWVGDLEYKEYKFTLVFLLYLLAAHMLLLPSAAPLTSAAAAAPMPPPPLL
jgi:peptidyl-prolyl isomerase H (cyclophilin H)